MIHLFFFINYNNCINVSWVFLSSNLINLEFKTGSIRNIGKFSNHRYFPECEDVLQMFYVRLGFCICDLCRLCGELYIGRRSCVCRWNCANVLICTAAASIGICVALLLLCIQLNCKYSSYNSNCN